MDTRLDLSPLDPDEDPAWRERLVGSVMSQVRTAPTPRARLGLSRADPVSDLLSLTRPALTAASIAAAAALIAVALSARGRDGHAGRAASAQDDRFALAEAVGLPGPVAGWVEGGRAPSAGEVLAAVRGY